MCFWLLPGHRPRSDSALEKLHGGGGGAESFGSGSCCSTPPGSSCYSSQRSSPAPPLTSAHPDSPLRPSIARSLSHLLLEEDEEEPETNVDTGVPVSTHCDTVKTIARSSSMDLLMTPQSERPVAVGAKVVGGLAIDLSDCLPWTHTCPQGRSKTAGPANGAKGASEGCWTVAAGQNQPKAPVAESRTTTTKILSTCTSNEQPIDEFFI